VLNERTCGEFAALREALVSAHYECFGRTDDLLIGLQLTHSGRFARPNDRLEPQILYHHPFLDRKFHLAGDHPLLTDDEIARLVDDLVRARRRRTKQASTSGHQAPTYLGHEFLSAVDRPSLAGFENCTHFCAKWSPESGRKYRG
jgi:hypothetical protein